ncbi:hypothetical protein [Spirosoma sp. KNUC1025]|uniref:hypothetical protein n=1 Tax=Spirosoma sp. KNUC1025 TaxID=2894082 RepID=UPI00386D0D89|nr:hypothetical protein LN737_06200 [Spirosoma sp. KNUC1025]
MITSSNVPLPGSYQYQYPTFVDIPQYITIHFLTPNQKGAFVSYPNHPNQKAPQIIPIEWFESVIMKRLKPKAPTIEVEALSNCGWL